MRKSSCSAADAGAAGECSSVEELEALLRGGDVPRGVRRRVVSDARLMQRLVVAEHGCAPSSVRFKVLRCVDCGCLEMSCFGGGAMRRSVH